MRISNLSSHSRLRGDRVIWLVKNLPGDEGHTAVGQRQVATIFTQLNQYHEALELDPRFRLDDSPFRRRYVRSSVSGQLVPTNVLTRLTQSVAPITINHQGLYLSVTLSFNLSPGHSLGDAVAAIQAVQDDFNLPAGLVTSFQGTAQAFQSSLRSQPYSLAAAIIAVYIILGVLYKNYVPPITILSTLPSAGVGALLALMVFGMDLSIIGLIGIILLIGIVKKNAIMMIDFPVDAERRQGLLPAAAIRHAALLRFRPIMTTTMSALLGAVPLAVNAGVGAELRRPLGITV